MCEKQLWGKARTLLLSAAADRDLIADRRRQAYVALARLAEQEHKPDDAQRFWREAALTGDARAR